MDWYDHQSIEKKWQHRWEREGADRAIDGGSRPKKYLLVEFPYPSGDGLHVGHVRSYAALDAVARMERMRGSNVLFPMGWDAFGLPTENYAIKTGRHPREVTDENIANFRRQMQSLGLSFDWTREIDTSDPRYYRWTQWIFLQFFRHGLAYQSTMPINWCPNDKIGLANEEVVGGKCERCGSPVVRKMQKQWMLKITAYADRLLHDLDAVDYLDKIKTQQVNWIGKSEGAEVNFKVVDGEATVAVFTTRPDTLFGATYLVLAPEHPLVEKITAAGQREAVRQYQALVASKSDLERTELSKEKTGVFTGAYALNPVNHEKIPIWIADYVLSSYGTGAIMAVPAHDERDWAFATHFALPIRRVIQPPVVASPTIVERTAGTLAYGSSGMRVESECWTGDGTLVNSGRFDGMESDAAGKAIVRDLESRGEGRQATQYKLRDWVFSRQHYWGEPIPVIHCPDHGAVPVPDDLLPVELPFVEHYQPTDTGESPLAGISDWVNTTCPICQKPSKRETDTMPNWAGSSWYFLRYCDASNDTTFADFKKLQYWMPVDLYNGGMEHTTLHLLYSRFWHKFLFDQNLVPNAEPYRHRHSHGIVLGEDGRKMSKSYGNVINPDDLVREYGADSLRVYELFMGPFEDMIPWSTRGIIGVHRFLQKVHDLAPSAPSANAPDESEAIEKIRHHTVQRVTDDLAGFDFNTAVSALMEFVNRLGKAQSVEKGVYHDAYRTLLMLLFPMAPHLASELWSRHQEGDLRDQPWPTYDRQKLTAQTVVMAVLINGRVRAHITVPAAIVQHEAARLAQEQPNVQRYLQGKPFTTIFVPGKLINFVLAA